MTRARSELSPAPTLRTAIVFAVMLLIMGGGSLVAAQSESPAPTPFPFTSQLCVDVLGQPPVEGWNATSLRQALVDGSATITAVGTAALCAPASPEPSTAPSTAPEPSPSTDPAADYAAFLIHGLNMSGTVVTIFGLPFATASQQVRFATRLRDFGANDLRYLKAHQPDACYADVWHDEFDMATDLQAGGRLLLLAIHTGRVSLAHQSLTRIQSATDHLDEITAWLKSDAGSSCQSDSGVSG